MSASGVATGVSAGTALVRATAANGVFGEATLAVTAGGGGGGTASELTVRVLDIGQGDANLIRNGTSSVIIDGGPDTARFGKLLDSLGLNGTTIDLVVLSHEHQDHHGGLRELFRTSRNITVRYFMENQNVFANAALRQLRDSIGARARRGQLIYRDSDDPYNRSTPVKLVGPDSASFSMWFAGDAEREEIAWFLNGAGYVGNPGMKVSVLKANHHGSCNGVTSAYVTATNPSWARDRRRPRTRSGTSTRRPRICSGLAASHGIAPTRTGRSCTSAQAACNPIP